MAQYAIPTSNSGSHAIALGPDGNLWFTEGTANQIAEINASTQAFTEFPIPTAMCGPMIIASGPNGNLWFTENFANQIGEINPTTGAIVEFPIPTASSQPHGITAGPDGNLWFAETNTDQIGKINPTTGVISEFPVPTANSAPYNITVGANGNLWFTEINSNQVGEINPSTGAVTEFAVAAQPSVLVDAIAPGPDGNLWFTEVSGNEIGEINPTTGAVSQYVLPAANSRPEDIVAGPDGKLWFTEANSNQIGELDPATGAIREFQIPTQSCGPIGIATGPGSTVWFAELYGNQIGEFAVSSVTAPTVTGIAPTEGPLAGGATVTITGANLANASVNFDAYNWGTILSDSNTQIVLDSPASPTGTPGMIAVQVTTANGIWTSSTANGFAYGNIAAPPILAGLPGVNGSSAVINVVSVTGNGTTATITTDGTPHGFWVGELVTLTGAAPGGANGLAGTVTVTGVPSATSFQFASIYNGSETLSGATVTASLAGAQRSMVDSIVYNFTEPVNLTAAAFSINVVVDNTNTGDEVGVAPTLNVAPVPFTNEWVVTFTDPVNNSVVGRSIANGAYSISINPAFVTAVSDGQNLMAGETDAFYRLYGDMTGAQSVKNVDVNAFNRAWGNAYYSAGYNPALDYNADGKYTNIDANAFNRAFNTRYNVALPQQADLAVTDFVSNSTPNVGDQIAYTVTLTNNGPNTATNVALSDLLPAGLTFVSAGTTVSQGTYNGFTGVWDLGSLADAGAATLVIEAQVASPNPQTDSISITHSDQVDPILTNNMASATVMPRQVELAGLPVVNGSSAVINIVSATGNGTTATITTDPDASGHGFWVGELVTLTGTSPGGPGGLAGTVTVTGVPSATTFQFASTYSGSESFSGATVTVALAGAQRSMVDSIVYNFDQPVNLTAAAFSINVVANNTSTGSQVGIAPTLNVAPVPFTNEWVVTFTDPTNNSVMGNSIANGAYSISINPALVTAVSDGQNLASGETDTFYRLYGDVTGVQSVKNVDVNAFNRAWGNAYYSANYNAALDYNDDGKYTNVDANAFNRAFNTRFQVATTI